MSKIHRSRARRWSRTAWGLSLLFGSLPLASRLFLGAWEFDGAAEIGCVLLIVGAYFHLVSRRESRALPDPATMLDQASELAASGQIDKAIAMLSKTIEASPHVWQAWQYRGELYVRLAEQQAEFLPLAVDDFSAAISLAPREPQLYLLRGHAHALLGDDVSSRRDYQLGAEIRTQTG